MIRPDLQALLAACRDQFADDQPRRVLADWLEEAGDADEAAVGQAVRLQLSDEALGGLPLYRSRIHELTRKPREAWTAGQRAAAWLDRGLWHVEPSGDAEMAPLGGVAEWVGTLGLRFVAGRRLGPWLSSPLASAPCLRLESPSLAQEPLECLGRWPALRAIDIHDAYMNDEQFGALAGQDLGLREFTLTAGQFTAAKRRALAEGPAFAGLLRLALRNTDLAGRDGGAMPFAPWAENLISLEIACNQPPGLAGLIVSPTLESLRLRTMRVPSKGLLARLPEPARLRRLALSDAELDDAGLKHMARVALTGLRMLDVSRNAGLTAACVPALGGSKWFAALEVLSLRDVLLGPAGGAALAKLPPAALRVLDLEGCGLGETGAEALAGWPGLAGVEVLELEGNGIGERGIAALARSPHPRRLRRLDLADNALGDEGVAALLASPVADELEWLSVRKNGLTGRSALALARTPRLARLRHLSAWGAGDDIPPAACAAVRERYGDAAG